MKVYVVSEGVAYEGGAVIGVYATKEKAEARVAVSITEGWRADRQWVREGDEWSATCWYFTIDEHEVEE